MPNFLYKAVSVDGRTVENEIVAPTETDVIKQLKKLDLIPIDIKKQAAKKVAGKVPKKVKIKEVIYFTKQIYTLLKSGVPMLVSLNAIKEQNSESDFRTVVENIAEEVEQGNSFSDALALFPKIFPPLYINAVRVGEMSGTLEDSLKYLSKYLEEENEIKQNVKKALRYPVLVISGLVGAFVIFTTFVVPQFIPIFSSGGKELPFPTRLLIGINEVFTNYGFFVVLALAAGIAGAVMYVRTKQGRFYFHKMLLELPILGPLMSKVSITRFAKIFYTMNRTGIPVLKALETLQDTMENEVFRNELKKIVDRIREGEGIANSLRHSAYFSSFAVEMISIGEQSGALDDMLESISNYYDQEIKHTVGNMTSLIEPIVTVALGGMVLLLALAIFLPMWDMMTLVH